MEVAVADPAARAAWYLWRYGRNGLDHLKSDLAEGVVPNAEIERWVDADCEFGSNALLHEANQ